MTKAGMLFEAALKHADIDLKAGDEIKVKVQGRGKHLRLVVGPTDMTDFEASILERSQRISENLKPYRPKVSTGERVRALRKSAGLTLEALASKTGISKGSLCSIEKGERPTGLAVLRKIANAMKVSISVLVD